MMGTAKAEDDIGTLAETESQSEDFSTFGRERGDNTGSSVEGHIQMEMYRNDGTPTFGGDYYFLVAQASSAEAHYSSSNNPAPSLDRSIVDVWWDTDDNGTVQHEDANDYNTGGYYGEYQGDDGQSLPEAIIEAGHDRFLEWIGSTLGGPIYSGGTLAAEIFEKTNYLNKSTENISREWVWDREEHVSNWSEYGVYVDDGEYSDME